MLQELFFMFIVIGMIVLGMYAFIRYPFTIKNMKEDIKNLKKDENDKMKYPIGRKIKKDYKYFIKNNSNLSDKNKWKEYKSNNDIYEYKKNDGNLYSSQLKFYKTSIGVGICFTIVGFIILFIYFKNNNEK